MAKRLDEKENDEKKVRKERNKAERQSKHPGVYWDTAGKKRRGAAFNRLTGKYEITPCFPGTEEGEKACAEAAADLRQRIRTEFVTFATNERDSQEETRGLPLAPDDIGDAGRGVVYCNIAKQTDWKPHRVVVSRGKYRRACMVCNQQAQPSEKGKTAEFCITHGGGGAQKCAHERLRSLCGECNPNITRMVRNCSMCGAMLNKKRMETKGGTGCASGVRLSPLAKRQKTGQILSLNLRDGKIMSLKDYSFE